MAAKHQQIIIMNVGMQPICNTIRSLAFAEQLKMKLAWETSGPTGSTFCLQHGVSLTSWGETITITLTPRSENVTQVVIRSECSMPTQIIDYGKNKRIVDDIYNYLAANVYRPAGPQQQFRQVTVVSRGRYCMQCGTPFEPTARFCKKCGARLI